MKKRLSKDLEKEIPKIRKKYKKVLNLWKKLAIKLFKDGNTPEYIRYISPDEDEYSDPEKQFEFFNNYGIVKFSSKNIQEFKDFCTYYNCYYLASDDDLPMSTQAFYQGLLLEPKIKTSVFSKLF